MAWGWALSRRGRSRCSTASCRLGACRGGSPRPLSCPPSTRAWSGHYSAMARPSTSPGMGTSTTCGQRTPILTCKRGRHQHLRPKHHVLRCAHGWRLQRHRQHPCGKGSGLHRRRRIPGFGRCPRLRLAAGMGRPLPLASPAAAAASCEACASGSSGWASLPSSARRHSARAAAADWPPVIIGPRAAAWRSRRARSGPAQRRTLPRAASQTSTSRGRPTRRCPRHRRSPASGAPRRMARCRAPRRLGLQRPSCWSCAVGSPRGACGRSSWGTTSKMARQLGRGLAARARRSERCGTYGVYGSSFDGGAVSRLEKRHQLQKIMVTRST